MQIDIVNLQNEKVGSLEVSDAVFGGRVNGALIWESVVQEQAAARRGTHATKNRAKVSGSGRKPWRQKGTGRARVGEIRTPLWRKGGTVHGPQPRSYGYRLPKKVEVGALRAALAQRMHDGGLRVVDRLAVEEARTRAGTELLAGLGLTGTVLLVDVRVDEAVARATRNLPGVRSLPAARIRARDVVGASVVVVSREALERLQAVVGSRQ